MVPVLDHRLSGRPFLRRNHDVFAVDDLGQDHRLGDVLAGGVELDGPEEARKIGCRDSIADLLRIEAPGAPEGVGKNMDSCG
jgi:hypothetical protein